MKQTATKPMTFKLFLEFIRLNAKTASAVPFILGLLYSIEYFHHVNWGNSVIYFIAQMLVAMFVTGFNNVQDYKLAVDKHYRDTYNIIGREHLSPRFALNLMITFITIACALGIWLIFRTNFMLLFMGGAGIFITIFYTYGPIPFSRFPLGELLSGLAEGFGVFFLTVYMNVPAAKLFGFTFNWPNFHINGNLQWILTIILVALPCILAVANVMFADNMSDLEQDIRNKRYTLPYYLGKKWSLRLYFVIMLSCFVTVILGVILKVLPWSQLIVLLSFPIIWRNLQTFKKVQVKETTFETAIQNHMLFNGLQMIGLLLGIFWPHVFH